MAEEELSRIYSLDLLFSSSSIQIMAEYWGCGAWSAIESPLVCNLLSRVGGRSLVPEWSVWCAV